MSFTAGTAIIGQRWTLSAGFDSRDWRFRDFSHHIGRRFECWQAAALGASIRLQINSEGSPDA